MPSDPSGNPPPSAPRTSGLLYKNEAFMDSDEGRPLRILAEYLGPLTDFQRAGIRDTIVFFGSARLGPEGPLGRYYEEARELARLVTAWSDGLPAGSGRFTVCSGGGPGIMEAANRGALEAGGRTIGLNIGLPHEQRPNPYITPELSFEFHYFFMRKLWFAHLARAIVVFPGGFGTLDELTEILTLRQTGKLDRQIAIFLYGSAFWREVLDFEALVRHGVISADDLQLFRMVDDPQAALAELQAALPADVPPPAEPAVRTTPAFAHSRTCGEGKKREGSRRENKSESKKAGGAG